MAVGSILSRDHERNLRTRLVLSSHLQTSRFRSTRLQQLELPNDRRAIPRVQPPPFIPSSYLKPPQIISISRTVTYLIGSQLLIQTTAFYKNLLESRSSNASKSYSYSSWLVNPMRSARELFLNENATCRCGVSRIKFVVSSSQIEGYETIQTYYLVADSLNDETGGEEEVYMRLVVISGVCNCFLVRSSRRRDLLIKCIF